MTVRIVTDSAAALPADLAAELGITVVPLRLHVGADDYRDGELSLAALVARFDEPVSTAAPSPGEFAAAIEAAGHEGPVVVLTIAAHMSSTYDAAVLAAKEVAVPVTVVDTRTAAGAQGLVALAASRAAAAGGDVDRVVEVAEQVSERVRLMATVPDLGRLARSGRVPDIARRVGDRVGVQPLFELRGGRIRPARPAFSRDAALERIVERCAAGGRRDGGRVSDGDGGRVGDAGGSLHVAVLHALDDAAARQLEQRARALDPVECFVGSFSPVMVTHTGSGLAGLAWWRE